MGYDIETIKGLKPMSYWAFPTGSSANQKKRLADAFKKNYILTLKRDGALYRAVIGEDEMLLQSRTVSRTTGEFVEKQDRVPEIMKALEAFPKNTVLMGEICFPLSFGNTISSDVVGIMGCNAPKAIARQELTPVNFYIFDVLMYDGEVWYDKPYKRRIEKVQEIAKLVEGNERIEFAKPIYEDLEMTVQNYLSNGWEGGVLMKSDAAYDFGKRPAWTSIKIKQSTDTIDLVVMETTLPNKEYTGKYPASHQYWENQKTGELVEGNYYAHGGYTAVSVNYFRKLVGGLKLGAYYGENLIEVCRIANLTDELRAIIDEDPSSVIGKVVEVSAMMIDIEKKSLRHPKLIKIREDKNPDECKYSEIFR